MCYWFKKYGLFPGLLLWGILLFVPEAGLRAQLDYSQLEERVTTMPDDTVKVNVLLKLGRHYCSIDNDKALLFLQEANTLSTSLHYEEGIGKSLLWQGRVYYYKDNYTVSTNYLDKSKGFLEKFQLWDALSFMYFAYGANDNITGNYLHAIEMFNKAIEVSRKTHNLKRISTCYSAIGTIFLNRGEPRKSLGYFREALEGKRKIQDYHGLSATLALLGTVYKTMNKPDSSMFFYERSLQLSDSIGVERLFASTSYQMAEVLIQLERYEQAIHSLQTALEIFESLKDKAGIVIVKLRLSKAMILQGKPNAIALAEEALHIAESVQNPRLISQAYKVLSWLYRHQKEYKNALFYQEKHTRIEDSLFNFEKERMLAEMEAKFQAEKKNHKIRYLTIKNKTQHTYNILMGILIVFFAAGLVLLFFLFKMKSVAYDNQQKVLQQEKIIHAQENKLAQNEKQLLQEQLESKNRELASKALEMLRYNDTISGIINKLESLRSSLHNNAEAEKPIQEIIRELENHTKQNIWNEFETIFKNIHSGFYDKLLSICPELSASEIKIAALLKLNLTTKEIAAITFKSEGGIKTTRYRLRKKLGLSGDEKLVPFLMQI